MKRLLALCLILLNVVSCSNADTAEVHHKAVMEGFAALPIAKALQEKYGGWSFIVHFNMGDERGRREWHTKVFVRDRYEVTYVQMVDFDEAKMKVLRPEGGGELYIKEMKEIDMEDGSVAVRFGRLQTVLKDQDLVKLVESGFEWERVNLKLEGEPLPNNRWNEQYWDALYPKQSKARINKETKADGMP